MTQPSFGLARHTQNATIHHGMVLLLGKPQPFAFCFRKLSTLRFKSFSYVSSRSSMPSGVSLSLIFSAGSFLSLRGFLHAQVLIRAQLAACRKQPECLDLPLCETLSLSLCRLNSVCFNIYGLWAPSPPVMDSTRPHTHSYAVVEGQTPQAVKGNKVRLLLSLYCLSELSVLYCLVASDLKTIISQLLSNFLLV